MASVSGKVGAGRRPTPAAVAPEHVPEPPDSLLEVSDLGVLPRGTVAVVSGARSLELKIVAAVLELSSSSSSAWDVDAAAAVLEAAQLGQQHARVDDDAGQVRL